MKPGFFLKEATRSMRRNAVPSFAALASVLVTTLVLGVFIPVVQATNGAANDVRSRVLIDVDLNTNATNAEVARVAGELRHAPHVKSIQFVSKQTGYEQERKLDPQAFQVIGYNPLPDIYRVTPENPDNAGLVRSELDPKSPLAIRLVNDPAISSVQDRQAQTNKILSATKVIKLTMALLALLLIGASALLISNTIRLSLFSRRREVEVMKLVGATDWFIRWPFVLEGLFLGAIGGGAAILLLAVAKVTLLDPLASSVKLISQPDMIDFRLLAVILMAWLSLRRFLRV
jgi:cell division transport system permease protein